MKSLVVHDSQFGNTTKVAEIIAQELETDAVQVEDVTNSEHIDLLVVGTPTHGGRPTPAIAAFLKSLTPSKGLKVACFDTRIPESEVPQWWLKLLMKTIGYAAPKMKRQLNKQQVKTLGEPLGVLVKDKEGPLVEGELDRAKTWAQELKA